jgi:Asp-tRNA(Asn)/Glu-tRNA(Gln) amidotransferase A subunit family amidase
MSMRIGPVLLDGYVPNEDARVVERVLDAGAIILGGGLREPVLLRGSQSHTAAGLRAQGCRR